MEAGCDGSFADDMLARGALGVRHVVQRPRHAQGPTLDAGLSGWVWARARLRRRRSWRE